MTAARLRQISTWTTPALVVAIVMLTLVVSPAQGDPLSRFIPGTLPFIGEPDPYAYDTCLGGLGCQSGHMLAFIALGLSLTVQAVAGHRGKRAVIGTVAVLAILVLFATASEVAQAWTGRDASADDWTADLTGSLLGTVLGMVIAGALSPE